MSQWEAPLREGEGPCFHDFPVFRARGTQNLEARVAFSKLAQSGWESPAQLLWGWVGIPSQAMGLDCAAHLQTQFSAESRLLYLPLQILFLNLGCEPSALSTGTGSAFHPTRPSQPRQV